LPPRRVEDAVATARRIKAARSSLLSEDWAEDPDAIGPSDFLTVGASSEQIRAAYMSYGARFEADKDHGLVMRLELDLDRHKKEESVTNKSQIHSNEHWEFDDEGYMRRRDASINDYKIDESECKFRWER
jgi:hypothetical protein